MIPRNRSLGFVYLNSLPNDNFLDWTKFKAVADNKLNVAKTMIFAASWFILTLSQRTNFILFQTERVCRQQFQI